MPKLPPEKSDPSYMLPLDLGYLSQDQMAVCKELVERCSRQIFRLIGYLRTIPNSHRVREGSAGYLLDVDH